MLNSYTKARVFEIASTLPPVNLLNVDQVYLILATAQQHKENTHARREQNIQRPSTR